MSAHDLRDDELHGLLDAYLDGELDDGERSAVDDLLARSTTARVELAEIDRVRSLVRGLPRVDAPFGFYERSLTRRRRSSGVVVASIGAVAAAILLILAVTPVVDRVAPPVEDLSERHTMLASSSAEMPEGYTAAPDDAPESAAGYQRMAAYRAPEGMHLVYDDGTNRVSVFEQQGHLEWSRLPPQGERMTMDGLDAWTMTMSSGVVTVLEHGEMVVTVIGGMSPQDAMTIAEAMPDAASPSWTDRMDDACAWVAEGFGFPD